MNKMGEKQNYEKVQRCRIFLTMMEQQLMK